jgi:hypothetical protein
VRRPELRPVADALDAHEAFAAVPLCDADQLPRGGARAARASGRRPRASRRRAGSSPFGGWWRGRCCASWRRSDRPRAPPRRSGGRPWRGAAREGAERELTRVGALVVESSSVAALGAHATRVGRVRPGLAGVAVGRSTRSPRRTARVALVAAANVSARAAAARLHAQGPRAGRGLMVFDASSVDARSVLPALLGDARGAAPSPGWLERAAARDAARGERGRARSRGAHCARGGPRPRRRPSPRGRDRVRGDVRVIVTLPREPSECDLPVSLLRRGHRPLGEGPRAARTPGGCGVARLRGHRSGVPLRRPQPPRHRARRARGAALATPGPASCPSSTPRWRTRSRRARGVTHPGRRPAAGRARVGVRRRARERRRARPRRQLRRLTRSVGEVLRVDAAADDAELRPALLAGCAAGARRARCPPPTPTRYPARDSTDSGLFDMRKPRPTTTP